MDLRAGGRRGEEALGLEFAVRAEPRTRMYCTVPPVPGEEDVQVIHWGRLPDYCAARYSLHNGYLGTVRRSSIKLHSPYLRNAHEDHYRSVSKRTATDAELDVCPL
jgi:hypothetical protein